MQKTQYHWMDAVTSPLAAANELLGGSWTSEQAWMICTGHETSRSLTPQKTSEANGEEEAEIKLWASPQILGSRILGWNDNCSLIYRLYILGGKAELRLQINGSKCRATPGIHRRMNCLNGMGKSVGLRSSSRSN